MRTTIVETFSLCDVGKEVFGRLRPEKRNEPQEFRSLTMKELTSFAERCRREYPQIDHCSVYCEIMSDRAAFRLTQLMVDVNGNAVKSAKGEPIGRIVHVHRLDQPIHRQIDGRLPTEFRVFSNQKV